MQLKPAREACANGEYDQARLRGLGQDVSDGEDDDGDDGSDEEEESEDEEKEKAVD